MTAHGENVASAAQQVPTACGTPEQVLASIVEGINTGNLDALMNLYEAKRRSPRSLGALLMGCRAFAEASRASLPV
jgi:hypothetical protein